MTDVQNAAEKARSRGFLKTLKAVFRWGKKENRVIVNSEAREQNSDTVEYTHAVEECVCLDSAFTVFSSSLFEGNAVHCHKLG